MDADDRFFLCRVCFEACEYRSVCHGHWMIECEAGRPDDKRRKPVTDGEGRLRSREPVWFLEAVGWLPPQ